MKTTLAYHKQGLEVELPDENVRAVLRKPSAVPLTDPEGGVAEGLRTPLGSPPLSELARDRRDAVIVVSDVTRPVPNRLLLPPIIRTLEGAGIARDAITILVATGLHGPCEGLALDEMLGPEIARSLNVANHDARNLGSHTLLGRTARGTEIYTDSRYVNADLKILTGLIEPHFMAGFSGGAKSILPGLAAAESIGFFHGYHMLADERCRTANIDDNPIQVETAAAARMAGVDFLCNVTLSESRQITGVFCGELSLTHRAGCEQARRECAAYIDERVDIAISSSAGYPLDTTYYQASKGICTPLDIVKPGGTIICAAGCADGIGSAEFEELLMQTGCIEAALERIANTDSWTIDQWTIQMIVRGLDAGRVLFYTDGIDRERMAHCLVEPVDSVEQGVRMGLETHGPDATIAVVPEGPYVIPLCRADTR